MHAVSSSQIRDCTACVSALKCKCVCVCVGVCVCMFVCVCVNGIEESGSLIASAGLPTLKWPQPQGRDSWLCGKMKKGWGLARRGKDMAEVERRCFG